MPSKSNGTSKPRNEPPTAKSTQPRIAVRMVGEQVNPLRVPSSLAAESVHLYLDKEVILGAIEDRAPASVHLMEEIKNRGWRGSTSILTVTRLLDSEQKNRFIQHRMDEGMTIDEAYERTGLGLREDHGRRGSELALGRPELLEIYDEITQGLKKYPFVHFVCPLPELWDDAEEYVATTNVGTVDSIHLATAVGLGCHVLVTTDKDLQLIAREFIPCEPPERTEQVLRDYWGFNI